MRNLCSVKVIKEILSESGFGFSKSLGQNFLIDEGVLEKMVSSTYAQKDTNVIEVGPGFGTLTQRLLTKAKKVVAIEIDSSLIPILEKNLSEFDNLKVINADVMKTDLAKLIEKEFEKGDTIIAANLPYYITTPIIMMILESRLPIKSLTIMIQKEVADRICAKEGSKDYGALSVAVNFYANPHMITKVPPSSFIPQPKVESTVISLEILPSPSVKVNDEKGFFKVVKAAFGQRRKTLLNALSNSPLIPKSKEEIEKILSSLGIDPKRRGETLSKEEFALISDTIFLK